MKRIKADREIVLAVLLLMQSVTAFADDKPTDNMFGVWGSLTLQGNFKFLSPGGDKFLWLIMNQARTREDTPKGSRFSEDLLFS